MPNDFLSSSRKILLTFVLISLAAGAPPAFGRGIEAAFVNPDSIKLDEWDRFAEDASRLGIRRVIITETYKILQCDPTRYAPIMDATNLRAILNELRSRNLDVVLGTAYLYPCPVTAAAVAAMNATKERIARQLSAEHKITQFYTSDEYQFGNPIEVNGLKGAVAAIRKGASGAKVYTAPMFVNQGLTPGQYALKAREILDAVGRGNLFFYFQDCAGSGAFSQSQVKQYFSELSLQIGRDHTGADLEIFTDVTTTFVFTGAYVPSFVPDIMKQIADVEPYISASIGIAAWYVPYDLGDFAYAPGAKVQAPASRATYLAMVRGSGTVLTPKYKYNTPPHSMYADPGNRILTQGTAGGRAIATDLSNGWVGFTDDLVDIEFDFGARTRVDWITVKTLENVGASVHVPEYFTVICDDKKEGTIFSRPFPATLDKHRASRSLLTHPNVLGIECAKIRLVFTREGLGGWTMLGGVSFVRNPSGAPAGVTQPPGSISWGNPITVSQGPPLRPYQSPKPVPPGVRLVAMERTCDNHFYGTAYCPTVSLKPNEGIAWWAVALPADQDLPPGYKCRLDATLGTPSPSGAGAPTMEKLPSRPFDGTFSGNIFPPYRPGSQYWVCAYCGEGETLSNAVGSCMVVQM